MEWTVDHDLWDAWNEKQIWPRLRGEVAYRLDVMLDGGPQDTNLGGRSLRPYGCEVDTVGVMLGGTRVALVLAGGRIGS